MFTLQLLPAKNSTLNFLFDTHQEINVKMKEKRSIDCITKLNKDDWIIEKDIKTYIQHNIFVMLANSFWQHKFGLHNLM